MRLSSLSSSSFDAHFLPQVLSAMSPPPSSAVPFDPIASTLAPRDALSRLDI